MLMSITMIPQKYEVFIPQLPLVHTKRLPVFRWGGAFVNCCKMGGTDAAVFLLLDWASSRLILDCKDRWNAFSLCEANFQPVEDLHG